MSQLESGATYIYERDGPRVYARKVGESERVLIGEEYALDINRRRMELFGEWILIIEAAEHNPALQDALERVKVVYELSKKEPPLFHHPV